MDELIRKNGLNQSWKVKVYLLNDSGNWDDCGTGVLGETHDPDENEYLKILTNEELLKGRSTDISSRRYEKLKGKLIDDDEVLLFLPVVKRNKYDKQGECIITWTDADLDEEIAISFLDQLIANEVWRFICMKIGKNPNECKKMIYNDLETLPMPELNTLDQIKHEPEFLRRLKKVFEELELIQNYDGLVKLCEIVKCFVFCEDSIFIEKLLSEDYYQFIFGIFEYEAENSKLKRPKHRQFLSEKSVFKNIFEIEDPKIVAKIQTNYHVSYLRDSVVSYYIEDQTANVLNTIVYYNNYEIYEHIIQHESYLKQFFEKFAQRLEDSISFLSEFIGIIKTIMQNDAKTIFLDRLMENNAFSHFNAALEQLETAEGIEIRKLSQLKIQLVEAIIFLCQIQITPFFNFLKSNDSLIKTLINAMYSGDHGLQILIADLFKQTLDEGHENKNEIHGFMYGKVLPLFIELFNKLENRQSFVGFTQEVLDLFSFCILFHGYRIRYFIIQHKLLQEFYKGFALNNKAITLAIIRFVRNVIVSRDEYLIKFMINYNLLNDIFQVYFQNASKYNLINSACLELFEKINSENIKKLTNYIVANFKDDIIKHSLHKVFGKMFAVYEQMHGQVGSRNKKQSLQPNNHSRAKPETSRTDAPEMEEMREDEKGEGEGEIDEENVEEEEKSADKENIEIQKPEEDIQKDCLEQSDEKNLINIDQNALTNQLLENESAAVDMRSKIKHSMLAKSRKEDEEKKRSNSSDSKSMDKGNNSIKIQFTLASAETSSSESGDEKDDKLEEMGSKDKRHATEGTTAEIEAYGGEIQKKIKL